MTTQYLPITESHNHNHLFSVLMSLYRRCLPELARLSVVYISHPAALMGPSCGRPESLGGGGGGSRRERAGAGAGGAEPTLTRY